MEPYPDDRLGWTRELSPEARVVARESVPPPYEGVHGLAAYRETWPGFFGWQASGACFELESLGVTAGEDVAFAYALLRCGTPEELEADPGIRLRLTLGLRKEDGRWTVVHEHHSFPLVGDGDGGGGDDGVREVLRGWFGGTRRKDLDAICGAGGVPARARVERGRDRPGRS